MPRRLARLLTGILLVVALVDPLDWAMWRLRAALDRSGNGAMGSVQVSQVTVASLKGNKEEYYTDATQPVACSRSVFPQAGGGACWWLQRHAHVVIRY
jgi:hypothetical protein